MKKIILSLLLLASVKQVNAQKKDKMDAFGAHLFTLIKRTDTVAIIHSFPIKKDLVVYIDSSALSDKAKTDFLSHVDEGFKKVHSEMGANIKQMHKEGKEAGIIWANAAYSATDIKYSPKPDATSFSPTQILILFTCNEKTYGIQTDCIVAKKGIWLINKFKLFTK